MQYGKITNTRKNKKFISSLDKLTVTYIENHACEKYKYLPLDWPQKLNRFLTSLHPIQLCMAKIFEESFGYFISSYSETFQTNSRIDHSIMFMFLSLKSCMSKLCHYIYIVASICPLRGNRYRLVLNSKQAEFFFVDDELHSFTIELI